MESFCNNSKQIKKLLVLKGTEFSNVKCRALKLNFKVCSLCDFQCSNSFALDLYQLDETHTILTTS
jgi:hypothetical protein